MLCKIIIAPSREKLSLLICDKVILNSVYTATEASYSLESLDIAAIFITLSRPRITKTLMRLHCVDWSSSLLFAYGINRIWAATWQNQQNACAPSEDSDQPGHPPPSLISVFAVRMKKALVLSCPLNAQRRLWSYWMDAQADPSLRWAHTHFVGFVMSWLICLEAAQLKEWHEYLYCTLV